MPLPMLPRSVRRWALFAGAFLATSALLTLARHPRFGLLPTAFSAPAAPGALALDVFEWNGTTPAWLAKPYAGGPLRMRVAIVSHPAEADKRRAIRESVLAGVPRAEVRLEHRFFVGRAGDTLDREMAREARAHGDVVVLDMPDSKITLGAKRWETLQWGGKADPASYDWLVTMDTDAFVRFAALARRAAVWRPELTRPHEVSVVWGHMLTMNRHWRASDVPLDQRLPDPEDEHHWASPDESVRGAWYDYPVGFANLISAHLVARLTAPGVQLAHNVSYPFDDMVVGAWVQETAPDALLVNDRDGFHDPPGHGWSTAPIGWDTVVVHHLNTTEMSGMRHMKQFAGEWERRWWWFR